MTKLELPCTPSVVAALAESRNADYIRASDFVIVVDNEHDQPTLIRWNEESLGEVPTAEEVV